MNHTILDDSIPMATDIMVLPPGPETLQFSSKWQQDLYENILSRLLTDIDKAIQEKLQAQLVQVTAELSTVIAAKLRANIEASLMDTVTMALAEETAKLHEPR